MRISCPCHFGTEKTLKFEISRIGGENITASDGRVAFDGDLSTLVRANICLATAQRVQILLGEFDARSFEELFENVKKLPLERFIAKEDRFPVTGHSVSSQLHSVPSCQSIIKKAAVTRLSSKYGIKQFEETGALCRIMFNIIKDHVSIYLDTTGEGLHKRGYRRVSNAAPISETLAAGIIDLSMVRRDSHVTDPMCGSGTMLIEAAYKAMNIAPGLRRSFACQGWSCIDKGIWDEERTRARDLIIRDSKFEGIGYDIDPECVSLTLHNARLAGVANCIKVQKADIKDFVNRSGEIVITNPPYGERLLEIKQAEQLYTQMGKVFKADKEHPCSIISPHEDFEVFFGKKAFKKRKLYNGMIKCNLFSY
ncbi:MAG: class I SAM-dependent RNA methyltransferase [Oscillospiraceae bacterium]|nr:class I SAM-dependent RNA methyltransferase [Oscillospiraceae bacterium]